MRKITTKLSTKEKQYKAAMNRHKMGLTIRKKLSEMSHVALLASQLPKVSAVNADNANTQQQNITSLQQNTV